MAETKRMTAEQVVSYLMEGEGLDFLRESLALDGAAADGGRGHGAGRRGAWGARAGGAADAAQRLPGAERGRPAPGRSSWRSRRSAAAATSRASLIRVDAREQALVSVVQEAYVAGVSTQEGRSGGRVAGAADLQERGLADLPGPRRAGGGVPAAGRSRAATRTCGWTRRSRRSATAAASSGRRWCSPTRCTSPATGR